MGEGPDDPDAEAEHQGGEEDRGGEADEGLDLAAGLGGAQGAAQEPGQDEALDGDGGEGEEDQPRAEVRAVEGQGQGAEGDRLPDHGLDDGREAGRAEQAEVAQDQQEQDGVT